MLALDGVSSTGTKTLISTTFALLALVDWHPVKHAQLQG
jgi:hypothetical protein